MATALPLLLLLSSFLYHSQGFQFPADFILPVTKHFPTLQYITTISYGTPLTPINLVLDLGHPSLLIDSSACHVSISNRPIPPRSIQYSRARSSLSHLATLGGDLVEDTIAVRSFDHSNTASSSIATVHQFLHFCGPQFLFQRLSSSAKGILGLGRTQVSLANRDFSLCLSSSNGVVLAGNDMSEISKSLTYTPLINSKGEDNGQEYFVKIKKIKVNGRPLSIDTSLLGLDEEGNGGTRLSTMVPYTIMERSIYDTFCSAFKRAAREMNITEVGPVGPFGVCFRAGDMERSDVGPRVPEIEFVLQSEMVKWRINGRNSMVKVSDEVMCLGFVNGGINERKSIVLGGYQMEDVFLHFDLATSMLGFSSHSSCSYLLLDPPTLR